MRFEVGEFFGGFGCLLVLGDNAVAEVVEAYGDHAVDRLGKLDLRDERRD